MTAFTEADVQLVAEALLRDYPRPDRALAERFDTEARAVLAALADAGRLTPADAEAREDWGVAVGAREGDPLVAYAGLTEADARKLAPRSDGFVVRRAWTAAPWVAADGTP